MGTVLTILIAVLVFGFLIFIHELGHYVAARIFKVTITEFSIGMGPRIFSHTSKKTGIRYSIALFPIGGFVAMAGENGDDDTSAPLHSGEDTPAVYRDTGYTYATDPNRFDKKPAWQRFIITAAGATVNIVAGFLAMIIVGSAITLGSTTVGSYELDDGTPLQEYLGYDITTSTVLQVDDEIIRVNGKRVRIYEELSYEIMRNGYEPVELTVIRDGEEIIIPNVAFPRVEQQGQTFGAIDFRVRGIRDKGFGDVMSYTWHNSWLIVRMVWESIFDLITGRYTFAALSGPVGISSAIGDAASAGFISLLNMVTVISINLGVMNLLPIPALDGGRLITVLVEMITGKRVPPKIEGMINAIGLVLLLGLSVVILVKDVIQLII
ncbi:MAG: site-2 protease family protein [Clostridia bacterium]|nr:site-2 protease family protein [Clostridia bacterium]